MSRTKLIVLVSGVALSTLFLGCGSSDEKQAEVGVPPPPASQPAPQPAPPAGPAAPANTSSLAACQSGYKRIGNSDCMPTAYFSPFSYACSVAGGYTLNNGTLCKQEFESMTTTLMTSLMRLPYSQPQHSTAFKPLFFGAQGSHPIAVFANDKVQLSYLGSSPNGWGGTQSSQNGQFTILGIPFNYTTWSTNCHEASITGISSSNGQQLINDGQAAGLVVGNGAQVLKFDTLNLQQVFASGGDLRMGFNVSDGIGSCMELKFRFKLTHCEDANGNSVSCP